MGRFQARIPSSSAWVGGSACHSVFETNLALVWVQLWFRQIYPWSEFSFGLDRSNLGLSSAFCNLGAFKEVNAVASTIQAVEMHSTGGSPSSFLQLVVSHGVGIFWLMFPWRGFYQRRYRCDQRDLPVRYRRLGHSYQLDHVFFPTSL